MTEELDFTKGNPNLATEAKLYQEHRPQFLIDFPDGYAVVTKTTCVGFKTRNKMWDYCDRNWNVLDNMITWHIGHEFDPIWEGDLSWRVKSEASASASSSSSSATVCPFNGPISIPESWAQSLGFATDEAPKRKE